MRNKMIKKRKRTCLWKVNCSRMTAALGKNLKDCKKPLMRMTFDAFASLALLLLISITRARSSPSKTGFALSSLTTSRRPSVAGHLSQRLLFADSFTGPDWRLCDVEFTDNWNELYSSGAHSGFNKKVLSSCIAIPNALAYINIWFPNPPLNTTASRCCLFLKLWNGLVDFLWN